MTNNLTASGAPSAPILTVSVTTYSVERDDPAAWRRLLRDARILDECGMDKMVVSDHVVFGERLEEYARPEIGGQKGGVQPTGPDGAWLEPITTLSVIAGTTSRLRLGTNILIAALRRPVILAKTLSTLDVLSGGRLDIAVGVGWQREEYQAAGLDFEGRGRLLDHTLEVCQTLWREDRASYSSPELSFEGIHMMPKPLQPGGVPIWVSGTVNPRVISRLARFGSGWIPWGDNQSDVLAGIVAIRQGLEREGRDPAGLKVAGIIKVERDGDGNLDAERTMAAVPALVAGGVTDGRLRLALPEDESEARDLVRRVAEAFRDAVGRTDPLP